MSPNLRAVLLLVLSVSATMGQYFSERDAVLLPFLGSRDKMIQDVRKLLNLSHPLDSNFSTPNKYQHPTHQGPSVLVMCINWGHLQLLLNFVCAMRSMKIEMPKVSGRVGKFRC
jgi:hypothetical protein